ncbi:hypothetical protein F9C07_11209 [Aspergillus flavus]|uniref:Uncharacterized protein n=1 Tax=Aspergillus flavus (strain ATCC 200026 / FGSC A1120 / IAM 13836 / NRRL 3357 / JCM 12722 / SRRC 167) TaxID=332952 RepID=A0A7U2MSM7_ASPFN|nr:uncharacterized protein G4B84_000212 [Aspergillus flavus NRRL3357]KAF7630490.1 hypothetical protein AFLA_011113 [Aspergillus flavus NRRL3357]KJJ29757.1 hypothetical protein AFLA70_625g000390 [Aspergillus flavus AF70]QMW24967.1 hypothetical protein G4B84_000212 [Aspergillus flavus NRRL3357]QRD89116.1 hypothetical protein F9C07_11209 [Aspergillus flavus]
MPYYVHIAAKGALNNNHLHVLTTVSREAADYFYRQLQQHTPLRALGHTPIKTTYYSPTFWSIDPTYDDTISLLNNLVSDIDKGTNGQIPEAAQNYLKGKLFIGPLTGQITVNPTYVSDDNSSGNINNRCYYIRNRHTPEWWFVSPGAVEVNVSISNRSKFRVQICPENGEPLVLVGGDVIQLMLIEPDNARRFVCVSTDNYCLMCLPGNVTPSFKFHFYELRKGWFGVSTSLSKPGSSVQWTPTHSLSMEGPGEDWVLLASEDIPC